MFIGSLVDWIAPARPAILRRRAHSSTPGPARFAHAKRSITVIGFTLIAIALVSVRSGVPAKLVRRVRARIQAADRPGLREEAPLRPAALLGPEPEARTAATKAAILF